MAELTIADLKEGSSSYESSRDVWDVLVGEDTARLAIEASSSGNDTALRSLLSQPQWIKKMLEKQHTIHHANDPIRGSDHARFVIAMPISNLDRAMIAAAQNGQTVTMSTLCSFAVEQHQDINEATMRAIINPAVRGVHGAGIFKAVDAYFPGIVNFPMVQEYLPLYLAVRARNPDVVAELLELGADPLHPVQKIKEPYIVGHRGSLLSYAAFARDSRILEMLLSRGVPLAKSAALHSAASVGQLENIRYLIQQHNADVDEICGSADWTPMHYAAWRNRSEAMELLVQFGAREDIKDKEGRTPADLLREYVPPSYIR